MRKMWSTCRLWISQTFLERKSVNFGVIFALKSIPSDCVGTRADINKNIKSLGALGFVWGSETKIYSDIPSPKQPLFCGLFYL
jgi:hypothetical protein